MAAETEVCTLIIELAVEAAVPVEYALRHVNYYNNESSTKYLKVLMLWQEYTESRCKHNTAMQLMGMHSQRKSKCRARSRFEADMMQLSFSQGDDGYVIQKYWILLDTFFNYSVINNEKFLSNIRRYNDIETLAFQTYDGSK